MENLIFATVVVVVLLVALTAVGLIIARLYRRASKEVAFIRTGFGGQQVVMNGGALVFPVLHEVIPVNMNTLRLSVRRSNEQALITRDRMRVDVEAEFYVRVQPTIEAIASAAQTLGMRTMAPEALKELVEGKFVDALRSVAAEMAMEELHEQRVAFVQKVQQAVSEDLMKNGLELETVSLTGLDQTNRDFFNPDNAFDARGLTKLTEEIEERRKQRNQIQQDAEVQIRQKNLEAAKRKLEVDREEEYAKLEQQRELAIRRAEQSAEIAREEATNKQEAEQVKIGADQQVRQAELASELAVSEQRIGMEQQVRQREILKAQTLDTADIEKQKAIELATQDRAIAIAEKSRQQSEAQARADEARALAAKAEEQVRTVRETEVAERDKAVELVEARKAAERQAIAVTVAAQAEKQAAEDIAAAKRIGAQGDADRVRIEAESQAQAERLRAAAAEARYTVEAAGRRALNEAANVLTEEQIAMQVRMALIEALPRIIGESVKPLERIDGIRILHVDGGLGALAGPAPAHGAAGSGQAGAGANGGGDTGLADQVVAAALRYRSQAPLVDTMLAELGLGGGGISGLKMLAASPISAAADAEAPAPAAEDLAASPAGAAATPAPATPAPPPERPAAGTLAKVTEPRLRR